MTTTLHQALSSEPSGSNSEDVKALIRASLEQKIPAKRKLVDEKNISQALIATLEEFMRNFTVIGFDHDNNPVIITRANTYLDGEALMSLSKKVLYDITNRTTQTQG